MDLSGITEGSKKRLARIKELKNFDDTEAINYAISVAWLAAEHRSNTNKALRAPNQASVFSVLYNKYTDPADEDS